MRRISLLTPCQVLPGREGRDNAHYLHATLWLYNEALSRPGLVSPHTVVCLYKLWDFCSSLHCVLLLNALCLLTATTMKGTKKRGRQEILLLLANCNAVQSKADSKFFHKPVQNWVLLLKRGELRPSLWHEDGFKIKRSWMVQVQENLPDNSTCHIQAWLH